MAAQGDPLGTTAPAPSGQLAEPPSLLDLPEEVLAHIAALGLSNPHDLAALAATAPRLRTVCHAAPLRLRIPEPAGEAAALGPRQQRERLRLALQAMCAAYPGVAELDLRGSPLADADVAMLASTLPTLRCLQLSGCKKLTAHVAGALEGAAALRTVSLQRCFQLGGGALSQLLATSRAPGSRLRSAALSHLTLTAWPPPPAPPVPAPPTSPAAGGSSASSSGGVGGLILLALHNSSKLTAAGLQALAAGCPKLEVLLLGGSTFAVGEFTPAPAPAPPPADPAATAAATAAEEEAHAAAAAMAAAAAAAAAASEAGAPLRRRVAAALGGLPQGKSCGLDSYLLALATELGVLACQLPQLRVLELSFCVPGLVPLMRQLAATQVLCQGRQAPLEIWDLCSPPSVRAAMRWQRCVRRQQGGAPVTPCDAAVLLHAAANCSSGGRHTPLHAAAEEGNLQHLQDLLELGAQLDARDRSGASPLFAACEAGRPHAVAALLAAGADATLRNASGEAPLYIAALKGHERVVDVLLEHCAANSIPWHNPSLYGDGWNPLMAAAVSGRTAVAAKLLQAAGSQAAGLVVAANRYGQTACHVAARKGSPSLVQLLVDAGGAASLSVADCEGKTAAEVARRHGNGQAWRLLADPLRLEQQRQWGTLPTAERPRAGEGRQGQRWVGRRLQQRQAAQGQPQQR